MINPFTTIRTLRAEIARLDAECDAHARLSAHWASRAIDLSAQLTEMRNIPRDTGGRFVARLKARRPVIERAMAMRAEMGL